MPGWSEAVLVISILALICCWVRYRRPNRRYAKLKQRMGRLRKGKHPVEVAEVFKDIYQFVHAGIAAGDYIAAYQGIDLIKTAIGEDVVRKEEPIALAAVIVGAVRSKQPEVAAAALDAYRQVLRRLPPEAIPAAAEQLGFCAIVSFRERQAFLIGKTSDVMFGILDRTDLLQEGITVAAGVRAIKLIGILALRRHDNGLFRELKTRLAAIKIAGSQNEQLRVELCSLTVEWLHRIVRNNDPFLFDILSELVLSLTKNNLLTDTELANLVKEWLNIAGSASLNPNSQLPTKICEASLQIILGREVVESWELALNGVGQVFRLTVVRCGLEETFPLILTLLNVGRRLLAALLRFGNSESTKTFRQQALFCIVRESLTLAEFIARQGIVYNAGDVVGQFYQLWVKVVPPNGAKSVKRFCQLLLAYWIQTSRQAKRYKVDDILAQPQLLSESDKLKLGFLK